MKLLSSLLRSAFAAVALSSALFAQTPALPPTVAKPPLPDLDVTYIERSPKFPPQGAFVYNSSGECVRSPESPPVKHWPARAEEVTFIAHVVNKGGAPSPETHCIWQLDGKDEGLMKAGGVIKALQPGEETGVTCSWRWEQAAHRLSFFADPTNKVYEICERNNYREDQTNGKAIMIRVHPTIAQAFDERLNAIGSFSFEDWIQEHIRMLNQELAAAVWPSTPDGCLERMRIDIFKVAGTDEMNNVSAMAAPYYADGGWQFHESPGWLSFALTCNFTSVRDDGLIHELAHQLGIVDNYSVESGALWRDESRPGSPQLRIYFRSRKSAGLMGTESEIDDEHRPMVRQWIRAEPDTRIVQGRGIGRSGFSEWEAAGMNQLLDFRRGHFGLYLSDLARENCVRVLNRKGEPVAGATVATFPSEVATRKPTARPKFIGKTDKNGIVDLGPKPWTAISCIAINALMFIRIEHPSLAQPEYHWLELAEFNLGCWKSGGKRAVLDVNTGIGAANAPKAPHGVTLELPNGAGRTPVVRWKASPSKGVAKYRIYAPSPYQLPAVEMSMPSRERPYFDLLGEVPVGKTEFVFPAARPGRAVAVTAVDASGRESSDAAAAPPAAKP